MPAASSPAKPSWLNMSPKLEAASRAAAWDRPIVVEAVDAHCSMPAAWSPKIASDFERVSLRSEAPVTEDFAKPTIADPARPAMSMTPEATEEATPAMTPIALECRLEVSSLESPTPPMAFWVSFADFATDGSVSPLNRTSSSRALIVPPSPRTGPCR